MSTIDRNSIRLYYPGMDKNDPFLSFGVSAPDSWWKMVNEQSRKMGIGRSAFIRLAVIDFVRSLEKGRLYGRRDDERTG